MKRWVLVLPLLAACQSNISTPFPPGLTPFEDENPVADPPDTSVEKLTIQSMSGSTTRSYGKGYVHATPAAVWTASQTPAVMYAACSTDHQTVTYDNEDGYDLSWLVHYEVDDILTVEWDDQWRYGVIEGTADAPTLGMIKHQKTMGSSFISTSEGTVQILATADPGITLLAFTEHLDAISGGVSDVEEGMQHNYDALVAVAHGNAIPACP